MSKQQRSKRARRHRKQARYAGLPPWAHHPSHVSARRYSTETERIERLLDESPEEPQE